MVLLQWWKSSFLKRRATHKHKEKVDNEALLTEIQKGERTF